MDSAGMQNQSSDQISLEQIAGILESVDYTVVVLTHDCQVAYINQAGALLVGRPRQSILGGRALLALPEFFGKAFQHQVDSTRLAIACQYEEYFPPRDLWTEVRLCPSPLGVLACVRDITARKRTERILTGQKRVLELVTSNAKLPTILDAITSMVEHQSSRDLCTILLLTEDLMIDTVLARGRIMVRDGRAVVRGPFEERGVFDYGL